MNEVQAVDAVGQAKRSGKHMIFIVPAHERLVPNLLQKSTRQSVRYYVQLS